MVLGAPMMSGLNDQLTATGALIEEIDGGTSGAHVNEVLCRDGQTTLQIVFPGFGRDEKRIMAWTNLCAQLGIADKMINGPQHREATLVRGPFVFVLVTR